MVVITTWQFHLKSKVRLDLSRWPQTQSPVQVSTDVVIEDLPVVSTRPSHSVCRQGVPIAAVMSVTDWCVSKLLLCRLIYKSACQSILGQQRSYEINFWSVNAGYDVVSGGRTRLLTSVTCSVVVTRCSRATLVVKGRNKKIFSSSWSTVEIFVPPEMPTKRVVWWP